MPEYTSPKYRDSVAAAKATADEAWRASLEGEKEIAAALLNKANAHIDESLEELDRLEHGTL